MPPESPPAGTGKVPSITPQFNPRPAMAVIVSQLNVYPVKGLKGIAVDSRAPPPSAASSTTAASWWSTADGVFLTQREHPRMATVWTEIAGDELRLAAPDLGEVAVPLAPVEGEPMRVQVWDSACAALAPSPEADRWLRGCLGMPCRLVYMPESTRAPVEPAPTPARTGWWGSPTATRSSSSPRPRSRTSTRAWLAHPVPDEPLPRQHRGEGHAGLRRGRLGRVRSGRAVLRMAKPCGRCQVTTTDQSTGEVTRAGAPRHAGGLPRQPRVRRCASA